VSAISWRHTERHQVSGVSTAKVIRSSCREKVDRQTLARLVASMSPFLDPEWGGGR
jgi:hypothetical protein